MKRTSILTAALLMVASVAPPALAGPIIDVGTWDLQPNQSGQTIAISVSGGDVIDGVNFNAQIGDGTNGLAAPRFTGLDLINGTILAGKNNGQYGTTILPHIAIASTDTSAGVAANGVIGILTVDTTGYTSGLWPLNLKDTVNGPTDFAGVSAQITDGFIRIAEVPEPASWMLLLAGAIVCLWFRRVPR